MWFVGTYARYGRNASVGEIVSGWFIIISQVAPIPLSSSPLPPLLFHPLLFLLSPSSSPLLFYPLISPYILSLLQKKCGQENKYLLTFAPSTSAISPPLYPSEKRVYPSENFLGYVEMVYWLCNTSLIAPIFFKKRGENPLSMGSLLFASTKIIHFPPKSKSL